MDTVQRLLIDDRMAFLTQSVLLEGKGCRSSMVVCGWGNPSMSVGAAHTVYLLAMNRLVQSHPVDIERCLTLTGSSSHLFVGVAAQTCVITRLIPDQLR